MNWEIDFAGPAQQRGCPPREDEEDDAAGAEPAGEDGRPGKDAGEDSLGLGGSEQEEGEGQKRGGGEA